ncbi:MAG: transcription-repair coupling factor [Dehalococcoidia bacterium]|nr:transcription-repair coupling factor [Dehalococcoidia bacterium]
MNLVGLLPVLQETKEYRALAKVLKGGLGETSLMLPSAALPYLVSCLQKDLGRPTLVVTARPYRARQLQEELGAWLGDSGDIFLFPEPDALPYEPAAAGSPSQHQRLRALLALTGWDQERGIDDRTTGKTSVPLIVAPAHALMHQVLSPGELAAGTQAIRKGGRLDLSSLVAEWLDLGYEQVQAVERPGTFSRRGGILDVFPSTSPLPVRLELYGNQVESLRHFDPLTQRSVELVSQITVTPAQESPRGGAASLLDYLPEGALLVMEEPSSIQTTIEALDEQAQELRRQRLETGELGTAAPRPYFDWNELAGKLARLPHRLAVGPWVEEERSGLPFHSPSFYGGRLRLLVREVQDVRSQGSTVVIASHQAGRLADLLEEGGSPVPVLDAIREPPPAGALLLVNGSLHGGWALGSFTLLTDAEIFGYVKPRRAVVRRSTGRELLLSDLNVGDYVVHVEHGIARFAGLVHLASDGSEKEYMLLEYAEGDRLYVPLDQIDRVSRYLGGGAGEPTLTRLASTDWARAKERARRSATDIAQDLLEIYAQREVSPGLAFSPDSPWQREMEDAFPYLETPDQAEAIAQVKTDMEATKPMDRLICGDVGYGKTEVALRAAFKAVMDGKQVAILVPTTVLAQQHFATFSERLAAFPVKVEVLSRFRNEKEQAAVLEGLKDGAVDICIGTHRLLQKDVQFKDLGLLVVDEEQRFGVMHKEHLKLLRKEVDVLTLTATPIPRSLYMSLINVRDMSVMETPPEERLPIKTLVMPYDEPAIRQAILRELDRGGQIFFVHNRVQGIYQVAQRLRGLVPEASIVIGHGQMPEDELERVMLDFFAGRVDVLVCTTIIEAGLDVPNANTIIINQAHRFGLAQLYQLRGRVGRGANLAYAYFLFPRDRQLTQTAHERLSTILEASELGAGYRIAMKDLEIRGAGNLLGPEQSGNIAAVGFDLYCNMLAEAVEELKARQSGREIAPPRPATTIDLPLSAYLPEAYIPDQAARISLYQRLARVDSLESLADLREEVRDRFGPEPPEVLDLLYVAGLKVRAALAGIASIVRRDGEVVESLGPGNKIVHSHLGPLRGNGVKVGSSQVRLELDRLGNRWRATLGEVVQALAGKKAEGWEGNGTV